MSKAWAGFFMGLVIGAVMFVPTALFLCTKVAESGGAMPSDAVMVLPCIVGFILVLLGTVCSLVVLTD